MTRLRSLRNITFVTLDGLGVKDRTAPRNDVLYEIAALIPGATEAERAELKLTLDTLKMIADMERYHAYLMVINRER